MRMSLLHLRGGVLVRLQNPKTVDLASIDIEINNACEEISGRIRDLREDWMTRTATDDLVSGKDIYDLPEDCEALLQVERFDAYGDDTPAPVGRIDADKMWQREGTELPLSNQPYVYAHLPERRIRVLPAPTEDYEDGLRMWYKAKFIPLLDDEDTPWLPEEIHECIVVKAVERLRQYGNVKLAQPEAFEAFRQEQQRRLDRFLRPMQLDDGPAWGDDDEFYMFH